MTDPRPGWYPDPAGSPDEAPVRFRWWDGAEWSDHVSDSADAPTPVPPRPQASRLRTVLVLTLGFSLFMTASLGVGLVLWRDSTDRDSSQAPVVVTPNPTSTAARGTPTGQLDLATRVATIGAASMTMPDDPYVLAHDPKKMPGVFDLMFTADATVHQRSVRGRPWSAAVALGRLSGAVSGEGLSGKGGAAVQRLSDVFYGGLQTKVSDMRWTDVTISGCPGKRFTANVHYADPKLPSRYDAVTVLMVEQHDQSVVVAMSSVPDDASSAVVSAAKAAIDSLSIS
ncbi:MAG TPA: DUF2510 domain-containing protein [Propionibacteriaceae bacterium]